MSGQTDNGFITINRDLFDDPTFRDQPVSCRAALIWLACKGRIVRAHITDLAREWFVTERRAAQIVQRLVKAKAITLRGDGPVRLICVETPHLGTCGFYATRKHRHYERGAGKWRGSALPPAIRRAVFERDGHRCTYCGAEDRPLHADHRKPVARGGSDDLANLITACAPCNLRKRTMTEREFRALLAGEQHA